MGGRCHEDMAEKMLPVFAFSVTCPWFAGNATLVAGWPWGLQSQKQLAGNLASSKLHDSCGRSQGEVRCLQLCRRDRDCRSNCARNLASSRLRDSCGSGMATAAPGAGCHARLRERYLYTAIRRWLSMAILAAWDFFSVRRIMIEGRRISTNTLLLLFKLPSPLGLDFIRLEFSFCQNDRS